MEDEDRGWTAAIEAPPGDAYRVLMPRLEWPVDFVFRELLYEGSNAPMRRALAGESRLPTGADIARRWRQTVDATRAIFLLRDSLFSQQDHPYSAAPYATMLPPGWIAAAVADVRSGARLRRMCAPGVSDDRGWERISDASLLFGSFPQSRALLHYARGTPLKGRTPSAADIRNARLTLHALAVQSDALIDAAPRGAEAVAEAGAEQIAASDVRYFGRERRGRRVIPILVENPGQKERREGKGLAPISRPDIGEDTVRLVRARVLGRRLRDGDIAIERYDLSSPAERERALEVLRELIPAGAPAGRNVWLWTAGRGISPDEGCGERVRNEVRSFLSDAERAGVDRTRLRLVRKPDFALPTGSGARQAFEAALERCAELDVVLPVDMEPGEVRAWLQ